MGERLIDDNSVIDFIDDNGETCFLDDESNFTCADLEAGEAGEAGDARQHLMGQICISLLLALLPLI